MSTERDITSDCTRFGFRTILGPPPFPTENCLLRGVMLRTGGSIARHAALVLATGLPVANAGAITYQHLHIEWQYQHTDTCDAGNSLGPCGPSEWIQVSGSSACGLMGKQSPINLVVEDIPTEVFGDANLTFHTDGSCCQGSFMTNEHTSELRVAETCPSTFFVTRPDGKQFYLHQLHFHSPSEHTWGGAYFPMEVHLVHVAEDGTALVVAVPIAIGEPVGGSRDRAEWLQKIIESCPRVEASTTEDGSAPANTAEVDLEAGDLDLKGLDIYTNMVAGEETFYHYVGSFTTPPCTTQTLWYMHTAPMVIAASALESYRSIIQTSGPDNQLAPWGLIVQNQTENATPPWTASAGNGFPWDASLGCNNRPVQPFHGGADASRTMMLTSAFHSGELGGCSSEAAKEEEEGTGLTMFYTIAPILLLLVVCVPVYCFCIRPLLPWKNPQASKRSVRASKAKKESTAAPPASQETAPLVASPSVSSVVYPVAYVAQPQTVYYAVPAPQAQPVQYVAMPATSAQTYATPTSPVPSPLV